MQLFLLEGWEKIILIDYGHVAYFSNVQISIVFEFCSKTSKVISPLAQSSEALSYNLNFDSRGFQSLAWLSVSTWTHFLLEDIRYVWLESLRLLVNFVPASRSMSLGHPFFYPNKWGIVSQTCSFFEITNKLITTGPTRLLVRELPELSPSMETRGQCQRRSTWWQLSGKGKLKAIGSTVCWGDLEGGGVERPGQASLSWLQWPFSECEQTLQRGTDLAFQMTSSSPW